MPDRMPIGVASNSPRALVEAALGTAGFGDAFDLVVGADDVREPKPAPEIYLRSCEALGAHPVRSIALEDSPTGVAAARSAGLYVIGVPSAHGVVLDAHEVFGSLTDAAVRRTLSLPIPWQWGPQVVTHPARRPETSEHDPPEKSLLMPGLGEFLLRAAVGGLPSPGPHGPQVISEAR